MKVLPWTLFVLLAAIIVGSVQAQSVYVQPMYQVNWTNRTIFVCVTPIPPTLNSTIVEQSFGTAIQIWNQAQQWFVYTYEPNHSDSFYVLAMTTSQTAQVHVSYVQTLPNGWGAETGNYGRVITIAFEWLMEFNAGLALHELGHVLGLADNSVIGDLLLSHGPYPNAPSTLDLYAAFVQFVNGNSYGYGDSVTLPSQIPYMEWSANLPVPEFPNALAALLTLTTSILAVARLRRLHIS